MPSTETLAEAERVMTICNACRYCEGHCAVFPAMEMRLAFASADLSYLANLCHDCRACYHHCQYAPPHEFAVDVPRALAALRVETYRAYAWPRCLAGAFDRNGLAAGLITAVSLALVMTVTFLLVEPAALLGTHSGEGAFYAVIPHEVMAYSFGAVGLLVVVALVMGFRNFWADMGESMGDLIDRRALGQALWDALTLQNLSGGGGDGCTYPGEAPSRSRRWFHHLTAHGFALCFVATTVATVYHEAFGWQAPYAWLSLPVILGSLGGIGLLIGPAGLLWLQSKADPAPANRKRLGMDVGVVLGLFLTLPYGKLVHAVYRFAALLRYALERRRPSALGVRED